MSSCPKTGRMTALFQRTADCERNTLVQLGRRRKCAGHSFHMNTWPGLAQSRGIRLLPVHTQPDLKTQEPTYLPGRRSAFESNPIRVCWPH